MKKQLLSILTAGCLMAAMVPAAFAADANDLQAQIDAAEAGSTIKLNENATITTPLNINKSITLDGNGCTLTYTGTGYAIQLNTNDAVTFDDLDLDATSSGGRGLEIVSNKPNFKLNDSLWNVNNRGIGFGSNGTVAGATVTIDSSIIQDSKKPENKTYENWSDQADTRGISLWNNKGLELNIIDNSAILGFGYPINMAGDIVDGVRDMADSVINITNSNIWGWCAMNIWTIDTTFNITNSNLKGFVETDNAWNSFATVVLNEGIYGNVTNENKANVFNISGGSVTSNCVSNNTQVYHCLFRLDKEFMSEFHFYADNDSMAPVELYCSSPFSAFLATYKGMEIPDFENWAKTKLTGAAENTIYNLGAIAPGVDAPTPEIFSSIQSADGISLISGVGHEGGINQ